MKNLFGKMSFVIASAVALFGVSAGNTRASSSDINDKTPLYLEHGNHITSGIVYDHESHASHSSHVSHASGY
jgi:hypothetical protein